MSTTALMLLPGLMCDHAVWAPQIEALAADVAVVVPAWGLRDSLIDMAQQVLDDAPTERFAVAGHSMGGRVALEVVRRAPERVTHLALLNTGYLPLAPGAAGEQERAGRLALLQVARTQGMRAMARAWARGMVHPRCLETPLFESVLDMLARSSPEQMAAQQHALLNRPDATPVLAEVRVPTLVLTGEDDAWSGPVQHRAIHEAIAGSTLSIVPGAAHMSTWEQPALVSQALSNWLGFTGPEPRAR